MSELGSRDNPLRVCIVGAGPSGFYAAEALLKADPAARVDMLDRLPAPYGLVRNGVAPDHPKLKQAIQVYDKLARENPDYAFLGNVTVGRDLTVTELRAAYHAVVLANGAESDRRLGVPGEDLLGSHTATELVGWYNGHPDYREREFDFSHEVAVIVGQGNVAADVARILAKSVDELRSTDIAEHALEALAESRIREIRVVGRRGPAQAKFTNKELREFGELRNCDARVDPAALELDATSRAELEDKKNAVARKNVDIFASFAQRAPDPRKPRRCHFEFLKSPVALEGNLRVERVVLEKNRLEGAPFRLSARGRGDHVEQPCGLVLRSIGYRGVPIAEVPFDDRRGVIPNREGRVLAAQDKVVPGLYTVGWIKRGPTGIIGTNRADAVATVNALLEDVGGLDPQPKAGTESLYPLLAARGVRVVGYPDWLAIDAAEIERGASKYKPREKFTRRDEMLAVSHSMRAGDER